MNRKETFEKIHAMHTIMTSLNDEDLLMWWLQEGIPDGTETVEDIEDLFSLAGDEQLKKEYDELAVLFAKIVKTAVADGYSKWMC